MTKIILPVLTAFFALSTPAFASAVIYQDDPAETFTEQQMNQPGGPYAEQGLEQEQHPNQSE